MKKVIITLITLIAISLTAYFYLKNDKKEVSYKTSPVERGDITSSVAAAGNLSAVTTVQIGTQVSGTIQKLHIDYNSRVKKGDILAELDPSLFKAAVEQAEGNLANAEAALVKAKITYKDAERSIDRNSRLLKEGIISQSDFDSYETAVESARAQIKAAEGQLVQAKGALLQAKTNLRNSIIRSPVDGVVISKSVDIGQTVAASFQTPTLFTIAKDLTKMQIEVSVDEADISRVKTGQKAAFTVDAYPEQRFSGTVVQVRSAPVINQNVVTYTVVVNVSNNELKLKPGMTANVSIETAKRTGVLKAPSAALRFRPQTGEKDSGKKTSSSSLPAKNSDKTKVPRQKIYRLKENKPSPVEIKTGISNNDFVEIIEGDIKEGDLVITEQTGNGKKKDKSSSPISSPMGGGRPH